MKIKALVGTALLVALAIPEKPASAADLLYNTPAPAPMYSGGPYVGFKGGVNWISDTINFIGDAPPAFDTIDTDTGFDVGVVFGYAFGNRWGPLAPRLEVELGYLRNEASGFADDTAPAGVPALAAAQGEINAFYGLTNLLFDVPMGWGFTPFFGGGIGFANVRFDNVGLVGASDVNGENTSFAWDLTAGIAYPIARNVDLEIAYRFLQFNSVTIFDDGIASGSDDIDNHQVNAEVRVHL